MPTSQQINNLELSVGCKFDPMILVPCNDVLTHWFSDTESCVPSNFLCCSCVT